MAFEGMTMPMILREALAYTNNKCARPVGTLIHRQAIQGLVPVLG
jgi:hypothetical protein